MRCPCRFLERIRFYSGQIFVIPAKAGVTKNVLTNSKHALDGTLARDYTVMQGLFNSFAWNDTAYEHADPLSVSFQIAL